MPSWVLTPEHHAHCVAGYAVIAWLQDFTIMRLALEEEGEDAATIEADGPVFPGTAPICGAAREHAACACIRALLAEVAALDHFAFGAAGEDMDLRREEILAQPMVWEAISLAGRIEDRGRAILPVLWKQVAETIDRPDVWRAVSAIAARLLQTRVLHGADAHALAGRYLRHVPRPDWAADTPPDR